MRFHQVVHESYDKNFISAIGKDSSLFVAVNLNDSKRGRPSITGLQAIRISRGIWWRPSEKGGVWAADHGFGRYSFDYANPKSCSLTPSRRSHIFPDDELIEEAPREMARLTP